uniref:ribosomal protein L32 n=1 Tax=Cypripedium lichiangense TaxID=53045 RepID=UPI002A811311|nr:ribosomal protein L32 [Cypripedium lichiangense]WOZ13760.1 ribosomal protein L32 [Cypripedium lichiangense]
MSIICLPVFSNFKIENCKFFETCQLIFFQDFFCRKKKLFDCPVETDLAKEKAFTAAKEPFFFQIFLRICFFDIEVRFFGTAIQK